jgi:aldehyde dehydrogenase (NAD+)
MTLIPQPGTQTQQTKPSFLTQDRPSLATSASAEPLNSLGQSLSEVRILQKNYFFSGATRSYAFRVQQLHALRAAIKRYEPRIFAALQEDLHRNPTETFMAEIGFLYDEIRHTLAELKHWMKPEKVKTPFLLAPARSQIIREALGEVLILSPWNYPVQLLLAPVVGAIAAGNCMVLKPSELSPHASQVIADLVNETFHPRYISVFEGGVEVSQALLDQPWDHIFFTGSTAVGAIVAQAAARFLTPVTLELGGKSPAIVDATADLKIAARRIIFGKFVNAGQTCIAPDYILVHHSKRDELVAQLKSELQKFYTADAKSSDSYGRIINTRHFDRLALLMAEGTLAVGGGKSREKLFIEPTVLVDVKPEHRIMQEEIFGPLLPILTFDSFEDVVAQVRSLAKPLALYLFSEDSNMRKKVLENLSFGGGAINDTVMHFLNSEMPFGGVGASGSGATHGLHSFLTFSHRKSVLINTSKVDLPVRYAPYTPVKAMAFRLLMDREQSFVKLLSMTLLSVFFIVAGIAHFINPAFYMAMMPPFIPYPEFMVALSGVIEVALGLLILWPKFRILAAWSMIALLIAVFPANIYMFSHPELFPDVPSWAHSVRLPFQALFIAWVYSFTKR